MKIKYTEKNMHLKTWCKHVPYVKVASRYCKKCLHHAGIDFENQIVYCEREMENGKNIHE